MWQAAWPRVTAGAPAPSPSPLSSHGPRGVIRDADEHYKDWTGLAELWSPGVSVYSTWSQCLGREYVRVLFLQDFFGTLYFH